MILVAILALAGVVLILLFNALSSMPTIDLSVFTNIFNYMLPYLRAGMALVNTLTYASVIQAMLAILIAVEAVVLGYKIVMWVAKKIPMFGVSD